MILNRSCVGDGSRARHRQGHCSDIGAPGRNCASDVQDAFIAGSSEERN